MPYDIKKKLRQYANVQAKASKLSRELDDMFEKYGVPVDNLCAMGDNTELQTEALAFLHNGECNNIEETISLIEEVFLHFANKNNKQE